MKQRCLFACFSLLFSFYAFAQTPPTLDYYLPAATRYRPAIPTPEQVLGFQIGTWHLSHDQQVWYLRTLAAAAPDRIKIEEYGRTYEDRPLQVLIITHPDNHQRLEEIRRQHVALNDPAQAASFNTAQMPTVLYNGYSIHGNEPSGANAATLVAYYLAAAEGPEVEQILRNTVILLDPSFNPDGLQRFSTWVNAHKSITEVADPNAREFNEPFPRGRTNHYWFDLNRDWLPAQHPESQGRVRLFQRWQPNVLTDHHEMGTNSTFFFQPGVSTRVNPLTPLQNQELTSKIGQFHAAALDSIGSLYFTKEGYDDFYYGKGSTYPDVQGSIGILFEQASSRGHAQESDHGVLRFPFTIRNQVTTALSTLRALQALRPELLDYQRSFFQESAPTTRGRTTAPQGYVFSRTRDLARAYHFIEMLRRHQIDVYRAGQSVTINGQSVSANEAYVVPLAQRQRRLIEAIFRTQTEFTDSLFYDISSWTFPLAFNLPYQAGLPRLGERIDSLPFPVGRVRGRTDGAVGWAFAWDGYYAPRALYRLQKAGVRTLVAQKPFSQQIGNETIDFSYGTILVPTFNQEVPADSIAALMEQLTTDDALDVYALPTGLAASGVDLGSRSLAPVPQPKIGMFIGSGISSYDAGEIWHLLDQRYQMPLTLLDLDDWRGSNIDRYTVLIMPDGNYRLNDGFKETLERWVRAGGTLVALQGALRWVQSVGLGDFSFKTPPKDTSYTRYVDLPDRRGAQEISGAIFQVDVDVTHPLAFGYRNDRLAVFKQGELFLNSSANATHLPLRYTAQPLLSGYVTAPNLNELRNTPAVVVSPQGRGRVIAFADNPNFRAFWYGTNKLFANALFFGATLRSY
ncbi:Zinc carboxypeptidase [Catalinimonas alkaloidigena]|uniref:Zinc carboxypeptidase n=1 Tax=Catalinimonas alkaloidigena TaxID=1075417 RepID=A0A1G9IYI0_9BACT|nr:M14 family metallopeptidase [Catalinimonas alkaloidigena]SDL30329.1 Zinc carboxypeptidase [Catalinimonas alkaloidigena]